jgi:uncharacterized protein (TIGR02246 family)
MTAGRLLAVPVVAASLWLAAPARAASEDAQQTLLRWAEAFNAGKPDDVAALYTRDATLWGTVASAVVASPPAIKAYFAEATQAGTKVRFLQNTPTELSPDVVLEVGRYEFERSRDGQTVILPARYSFVMVKQGDIWKIAHQHSSLAPKAP